MNSKLPITNRKNARVPRRAILVLMLLFLTACNGVDEMRWKEQVYLHDGQLIEVDRVSTRKTSGFPNSRRGTILTQELRYAPLGVVWKAEGAREQLVSFDIVDGIPYLVAVLATSKEKICADKRRGDYIATYYRWKSAQQERISVNRMPIAVMRLNLSGVNHWGRDQKGDRVYLTWKDVTHANAESSYESPMLLTDMFAKKSWLRCN